MHEDSISWLGEKFSNFLNILTLRNKKYQEA